MRELELLSELPAGKYAEIKALISYPENDVKRAQYLSNHLKEYYIKCLEDIIHASNDELSDDAVKGVMASALMFDAMLFDSLGGIRKIMSTDLISEIEQQNIAENNRLIGLCICLLYFGKNNEEMFKDYKLTSQGAVLKHMCLKKYSPIYNTNVVEKTIQSYCIKNRTVLHLTVGEFVYSWMLNFLQDEKHIHDEEVQIFFKHYSSNACNYILGYAKTLYDWGINKTVKRRPQNLINEAFSVAIPSWVNAVPFPYQLRDYLLNRIKMSTT